MQAELFGAISSVRMSREMITGVVGGVVASVIIGLAHWLVYRVKHSRPMRVWYEPQRHQRPKRIDLPPHAGARVPITLEIFRRIHLEGVRFSFTGDPNAPEIANLFD